MHQLRPILKDRAALLGAALSLAGFSGVAYGLSGSFATGTESGAYPAAIAAVSRREDAVSVPVRVVIPAILLDSAVVDIGLLPDRSPAVPSGDAIDSVGWLRESALPGQAGTSILIGHLTTVRSGPSAFSRLHELSEGHAVTIFLGNGSAATYRVVHTREYAADIMPDSEVYGMTDKPSLRLITCAGAWDRIAGRYDRTLVVFAELESRRQ